ncbi:MAG: cupin domain-containing protein [Sphingomicrobium sp.]
MNDLPLVRRVVTGHDSDGKAIVQSDTSFIGSPNPAGTAVLTLVWTSTGLPVDIDDPRDGRDREVDLVLPGGSVIRTVDMMPGTVAPMHRTSSLDYGIVISGSIELVLDDGSATLIEQGGIVIQRGTIHSWRNPSPDVTARMVFVLLEATPAMVDGKPLPDVHPRSAAATRWAEEHAAVLGVSAS